MSADWIFKEKKSRVTALFASQLQSVLSLKGYKLLSTAHKEQGVVKTLMKAQVIKKHLDISDKISFCFPCKLHTIKQIILGCTELWAATPGCFWYPSSLFKVSSEISTSYCSFHSAVHSHRLITLSLWIKPHAISALLYNMIRKCLNCAHKESMQMASIVILPSEKSFPAFTASLKLASVVITRRQPAPDARCPYTKRVSMKT